jgi:hypothetical protein
VERLLLDNQDRLVRVEPTAHTASATVSSPRLDALSIDVNLPFSSVTLLRAINRHREIAAVAPMEKEICVGGGVLARAET